jgi:cardiolipin synthase
MIREHLTLIISIIIPVFHVLGAFACVHVIMKGRTSQGTIAWVLSLIIMPYITLPFYLVFGRSKFQGYVAARRKESIEIQPFIDALSPFVPPEESMSDQVRQLNRLMSPLIHMPFTRHNAARPLVDGSETFAAIFDGIDRAQMYILVQFFIVHDDEIGQDFKQRLIEKARDGVRIYFLYDEVGCHKLPNAYLQELRDAGIIVSGFKTDRGWRNRFQLNFRNHRKIVIIDGREAYLGGLNVGDEYMSRSERFGHWRDTHVAVEGPAVLCVQVSFAEDWYWATQTLPDFNWTPVPVAEDDNHVFIMPTGPADDLETCALFFIEAITNARERVWITSPYFVPDIHVVSALQLAALRGVDVRIMLPESPDHLLVYLSSFSYLEDAEAAGVKIYRYQSGFLHQKVLLVDNAFAAIGTVNLDNRSFRINFEISLLCSDTQFVADVDAMLVRDFTNCRKVTSSEYKSRLFLFRLAVRGARLLSPLQ